MKILLVNPNTSSFVTDKVAAEARRVASAGTEIIAVTGQNGSTIVSGRAEDALAAAEALRLAAERSAGCDAIVLAISFDSGLAALREMLSIPVVGMSEAAMLAACTLGGRFSMLTFGNRAAPIYAERCKAYGLGERLANVVSLAPLSDAEMRDPDTLLPRLVESIERTAAVDGAEAVILAGAIFAGLTNAVADRVSIPVLNGVAEATGMAEMLVKIAPRKPRSGSYQPPSPKEINWPDNALVSYFSSL
jgi:Asp/Glu/hydantoin racemase